MHVVCVKFIFSINILFSKSLLECETMCLLNNQTIKSEIVNQGKMTPFPNPKIDIAKTENY
jgi:hypothetical protein